MEGSLWPEGLLSDAYYFRNSMWDSDIEEYCQLRGKDPAKVEAILLRKGWNPDNYSPSMRSALFNYLDKWYTLSIKNLPEPATRKNPITYHHTTELPYGWKVETLSHGNQYKTLVSKGGQVVHCAVDLSIMNAESTHLNCVEDIYDQG